MNITDILFRYPSLDMNALAILMGHFYICLDEVGGNHNLVTPRQLDTNKPELDFLKDVS